MAGRDFVFYRNKTTGRILRYVADPRLDSKRYERVEDPKQKHRANLHINDDLIEGATDGVEHRRAAK